MQYKDKKDEKYRSLKQVWTICWIYSTINGNSYGIVYASHKFLGDASYGILGVFSCFLLGFLYAMAKSDVEGKEREARWAEEDRARETKPKMLME